jgi:hypothetical protein
MVSPRHAESSGRGCLVYRGCAWRRWSLYQCFPKGYFRRNFLGHLRKSASPGRVFPGQHGHRQPHRNPEWNATRDLFCECQEVVPIRADVMALKGEKLLLDLSVSGTTPVA